MRTSKLASYALSMMFFHLLIACNTTEQKIETEEIQLDKTEIELTIDETAIIQATVIPDNATDKVVIWSSSDNNCATVEEGIITAVGIGECTISASIKDITATCQVTVKSKDVEQVLINKEALELKIGDKEQLTASVYPEDAEHETITWRSSNENVITVDNTGLVEAVGKGQAIVYAACNGAEGTCNVTVTGIPVESVNFNVYNIEMYNFEEYVLTATVLPENAEYDDIIWKSENSDIATVDSKGRVVGECAGETKIIAEAGGKRAECTVKVTDQPVSPGDYYYSDGTYSSTLKKEKEVIGIVFWTGDPTSEDPTLKKEHPRCKHGLVVSLKGDYPCKWQGEYKSFGGMVNNWVETNTEYQSILAGDGTSEDDLLNKIVGYNNTQALLAFNQAPENSAWQIDAVSHIQELESEMPSPDQRSSGWYLPSAKELSLLCTGPYDGNIKDIQSFGDDYTQHRRMINQKIFDLYGEELEGDVLSVSYWSSSEVDESCAVINFFKYGTTYLNLKKDSFFNTDFRARYILAF